MCGKNGIYAFYYLCARKKALVYYADRDLFWDFFRMISELLFEQKQLIYYLLGIWRVLGYGRMSITK